MAQEDILQNNIILPDEEKSNFDIMEWVFRILHYWYLFVIAGILAFSLAFIKNKRVIASYLTTGTMIIQEPTNSNYGASALMQGFGVDAGYKNVNNQLIILVLWIRCHL